MRFVTRVMRAVDPRRVFDRGDEHMSEIISGAALAFFLRGIGAGFAFMLNVAIARLLGVDGAGLYFLALSVISIISIIARLGLDNALLRFISVYASKNEWRMVGGVFSFGIRMAIVSSIILTLTCFTLAPWLALALFEKPELALPLRWMSLGIMGASLMMLMSECLKGVRNVREAMLVSGVLYPLIALALVWPLVTLFGASGASAAYVLGTGGAAVMGYLFWRRTIVSTGNLPNLFPVDKLLASSRPLFVMSILNGAILLWVPLLLLGVWGTTEESGIFGAAVRVVTLLTFFLHAVNTIVAPKFAALYHEGEMETLGRVARHSALLITLAASPVFILFFAAADDVMSVFGPDFHKGGLVLTILTFSQFINSITGSVGFLLAMSGNERHVRNAAILGALALLLLSVVLIPSYGMVGAAIAMAVGLIVDKTAASLFVWKKMGILGIAIPRNILRHK